MVSMASAANCSFFPISTLPLLEYYSAKGTKLGWGLKSKHANSSFINNGLQVKANIIGNGTKVVTSSDSMLINPFGEFLEGLLTFRQNFFIRSYDVGSDSTASIQTLMNIFQETLINRFRTSGLLAKGFSSPTMVEKNLTWVFTQTQILVDRYPIWGDVVQVDNWMSMSGKNAFRVDWLMRDYQTGEILARASSVSVMMNKVTRRLCKMPEEVREELESHFVNSDPIFDLGEDHNKKVLKLDDNTADYICTGLNATRNDLDLNQHVNNVKYVGWVLESVPRLIFESHEVATIRLEYRRECGKDNKFESLTAKTDDDDDDADHNYNHLLRLENGVEVVRGMSKWRPKLATQHQPTKQF